MKSLDIQEIAQYLENAELEGKEITRVTADYPELTVEQAYQIQAEIIQRKLNRGNQLIGPKMGLTSKAKMAQMNIEEPIFGYIFDYMVLPNRSVISLGDMIHPKVEAEVAFVLKKDLEGSHLTVKDVLEATDYILPALEIIDSRYENFKFQLPDVIADNTSACRVVFGERVIKPTDLELDLIGVRLEFNGEIKALGASAAVLGHPANSIIMLAKMLARQGKKMNKGDIILTGAITEAIMLEPGSYVEAKYDLLGDVTFSCN